MENSYLASVLVTNSKLFLAIAIERRLLGTVIHMTYCVFKAAKRPKTSRGRDSGIVRARGIDADVATWAHGQAPCDEASETEGHRGDSVGNDPFNFSFEVLLYDLSSTYAGTSIPAGGSPR